MNAHHHPNPAFLPWKRQMMEEAKNANHTGWLDEEEIHALCEEATRKGVSPATLLCCHAVTARRPASDGNTPHPAPVRVMVVDLENAAAERLGHILAQTGMYVVETATEVREAMRKATVFAPELLLVEMALPGSVNGQGLVYYINRILQRSVPAIILESVLENSDYSIVAIRGTLHLRKPLKLRSLLHCMNQLVPKR
ncbi:MAG: response regulator [Verrucomicrobiales bacterium]|nr:response regulator [Verrucomicrobiales bacterium]